MTATTYTLATETPHGARADDMWCTQDPDCLSLATVVVITSGGHWSGYAACDVHHPSRIGVRNRNGEVIGR